MIRAGILAFALAGVVAAAAARAPEAAPVRDAAIREAALPARLSDYGFFADARAQQPAAGVVPYRLNIPLYSDGADKLRFVYVPAGSRATGAGEGLLDFPVGSALIKTFAYGAGAERRLIETRVLLHRADGWVALPYAWNAEQSEATLALAGGWAEVTTPRGEAIRYRIPNKNQCKECHGVDNAVVPIGPKARNLERRWLEALVGSGRLDALPAGADTLPRWETRAQAPLDQLARGYLDVNCAHCHRPGATASNSGLDLRWEQADGHALGIAKRPVAAGRGSGGHEFDIVPGQPESSILAYRMRSLEGGVAMPELGKATRDEEGLAVIERWIAQLGR